MHRPAAAAEVDAIGGARPVNAQAAQHHHVSAGDKNGDAVARSDGDSCMNARRGDDADGLVDADRAIAGGVEDNDFAPRVSDGERRAKAALG